MNRTIFLCLVTAILSGFAATHARGASGRATGTANGASANFAFSTTSDFPPSAPGDFQIAIFTSTKVTLSWVASVPAVQGRTIDHYDVMRNGAKIGQTQGSQLTIDYNPTGTVLEFFSLRAVDSKGIASAVSAEILAPRTATLEVGGIEIESKTVHAEREIVGIQGFLSDKRYRKGTYTYHLDRTLHDFHYSTTIAREDRNFVATFDPDTNRWVSLSVAGSFYYELIDHLGPFSKIVRGTWTLVEGDPPSAELRAADGTLVELTDGNFTGNTWGPSFGSDDSAVSDTYREYYGGPDSIATERLEDEITPQDFRAGVEADYAAGVALLPTMGWSSRIDVSFGDTKIRREGIGNFFELASRSYGERIGSHYRLRVPGTGTKTVRWAEVTFYDDGSDPTAVVRQETINLDQAGGYSQVYVVSPPDASGSTDIHILSVDVSIITPALSATPSDSQRLFLANAVFTGEAGEIAISTGSGWFSGDGTNSAIVTFDEAAGVIKLLAIDPAVEAEEGIEIAIGAGYEIASGTDLLADPNLPGFPNLGGWKLVAIGLKAGIATIQVALTTAIDASPTVQTVVLTIYPKLEVAVDANRDGQIRLPRENASDATGLAQPFRFWLNDDDDSGDMGGDDIPGKTTGANYADGVVNGTRDLVDFFPVFLDLKQLLTALPPSASVKYKIKQADSALNFVYTNLARDTTTTRDGALAYQKKILATGFGPDFTQAAGAATTQQITAAGIELSSTFLAGVSDSDWGVLLIEGRSATTAPLVLSVEKDGTVITEVKLELRISNVEDMFRQVDMTQVPKKYDGSTYTLPASVPATRTGDPGEAWPDSQTNGKYFVFLHGFNVDGQRARGWSSEIFKRLHVFGSKARFVGVTWHGATGIKLGGSYTDYHGAVFNAFQTGDSLAGALSFTSSADVTIAAHSLGNIVASQAIQSGGLEPARYYMINAASPIEAYDLPNVPDTQITRMTESKWKLGAPGNRSTYAANWHQFFEATPSDHRSELKWKGRFGGILLKTHNFFSPGDDVVEDSEWDSPSILGLIFTQGFNFSRGAWVTQEFAKGANVGESLAVLNLSRVQGGWGESVFYTPPWGIGSLPPSPDQTREPYFGYFLEHDLFDVDSAKASAKARQKLVQYDLLARGLPALSFAVAVHPLAPLENPDNPSLSRNFDMEAQGRDQNVWPPEGHNSDGKSAGRWLHSDFKNVALPYVHKMYEEMINRGSLK